MNAVTPLAVPHKIGLRAVDYLMLSDAGAFDGYGRTELIGGEIWAVNAIHSWHAKTLMEIGRQIGNALETLKSPLRVYSAGSVFLTEDSVPEPDISIGEDNDEGVLPLDKLKLAIEISDSTAATDLGVKLRLYAGAGVPEYWVVERDGRVIHQMWSPVGSAYTECQVVPFGDRADAATLASLAIETSTL